jgi:DNA-3-methyladenine glycosylase II
LAGREAEETGEKPTAMTTLHPVQPFDFGLSCGIYTRTSVYAHTAFLDGTLYKCLELLGKPNLIAVREEKGALRAKLFGPGTCEQLESVASWIISSDLDLSPFYAEADDVIRLIIKRLHGLKPPRTATVYEALIIAFTEQQISLRIAMVFQRRIIERYGKPLQYGDFAFHSFPSPAALAAADTEELRGLGLSRNKADFITSLSKRVDSGELDLESLKRMPTGKAREALQCIHGVGEWTSDYVLVRGLGRTEMVPYDDLGTQDSVGLYYKGGVRATRGEVEEILGRFGQHAGLANYYLIYSRFFGVEPRPN